MNTAFKKIHTYLREKKVEISAYQDYLQLPQEKYEILTQYLTQRNISLQDFYHFLSIRSPEDEPKTPPTSTTILENSELLGKSLGGYQLFEILGEGGMGVVYKAYHPGLNQIVAMKLIKPEFQKNPTTVQRFLREMKVLAKLEHPGIVKILNSGKDEGHLYLVMEYVSGISLNQKNATLQKKIEIFLKILETVSYTHQQKIIHRDLKLENILISEAGDPKILDFGLAKELQEERLSLKLTQSQIYLGTLLYMAPEQLRGEVDTIDERTDIYALGVCFYKFLSGKYPYPSTTYTELLQKIEQEQLPLLSRKDVTIHRDLDAILFKALASDPNKRYLSANEFEQDLRNFLKGSPIRASLPSWRKQYKQWIARHRILFSGFWVGVFLLIGLFWGAGWTHHQEIQQQFESHYQRAKASYEQRLQIATSHDHKKWLFEALHFINQALTEKNEPRAEILKWNIGEELLEIAYESRSYFWADYLVQELKNLNSIDSEAKLRLTQKWNHEIEKDVTQQIKRLESWKKKLSLPNTTSEKTKDAVFAILKMSAKEIVSQVEEEIKNGTQYILTFPKVSEPDLQKINYYQVFLKVAKYWDKPELGKVLFQEFQILSNRLAPIKETLRIFEQENYHILLFQAIVPYSKSFEKDLREIRWKMGLDTLFYRRTKSSYDQMLKSERFHNENISHYSALKQGLIYEEKGQYLEALNAYTRSIQEYPLEIDGYEYRGLIREQLLDFKGAIADFTEVLRIDPSNARGYINRGKIKAHQEDLKGSIADFTEAIRVDNQFFLSYYNRGRAKSILNDFEGAIADFTESIRLNPKFISAYLNRGCCRIHFKDFEGGIRDFTEVLRLNPEYIKAYLNRGTAYFQQQNFLNALADYNECAHLDPQETQIYYNRALVKEAMKDIEGALVDSNEAIRLDPQKALFYHFRGNIKIKLKDLDGAMNDYNEAIRLDPQFVRVYYDRGILYYKQKNINRARSEFLHFLGLTQQIKDNEILILKEDVFEIFPELRGQ